jgi:hypothetical protein
LKKKKLDSQTKKKKKRNKRPKKKNIFFLNKELSFCLIFIFITPSFLILHKQSNQIFPCKINKQINVELFLKKIKK